MNGVEAIFNLKLPMKKRYEEVAHILDKIRAELAEKGINAKIQAAFISRQRRDHGTSKISGPFIVLDREFNFIELSSPLMNNINRLIL